MPEFDTQVASHVKKLRYRYVGSRGLTRSIFDREVSEDNVWECLAQVCSQRLLTLQDQSDNGDAKSIDFTTGIEYARERHNFGVVKGRTKPLSLYMPSVATSDFARREKGVRFAFFVSREDEKRGLAFVNSFHDLMTIYTHPTMYTLSQFPGDRLEAHIYDTQKSFRINHFSSFDETGATHLTASDEQSDIQKTFTEQTARGILYARRSEYSARGVFYRRMPSSLTLSIITNEISRLKPVTTHISDESCS